jgi:hypothetical protein
MRNISPRNYFNLMQSHVKGFIMTAEIFHKSIIMTAAMLLLVGLAVSLYHAFSQDAESLTVYDTGKEGRDIVSGNLIQFNNNGAWSWYQDERAVVDAEKGMIIIGSVANKLGVGGDLRNGNVEATIFDRENMMSLTYTLKEGFTSYGSGDDHNVPAFLVLPEGRYLAVYAGHNKDKISRYHIYEGVNWSDEHQFDWKTMPGGSDFRTTYSNLFYLSAEGRVYNIARNDDRSPNLMVSSDLGETWSYGGQLTAPKTGVGYLKGYFKYSSNGVDRIDFIATEHHPRKYNTSIYHGYIKGGKSYASDGSVMDEDIKDKSAPSPDEYTLVFASGTVVDGTVMTRCWNIDLQTYSDGTITALFKARANDSKSDHRLFYARYDGSRWRTSYLGMAGPQLYDHEGDYVGLGALHPHDPYTVYISTPVDPRDGTDTGKHEIYEGVSMDGGTTWKWRPITQKSTYDNLRPIVPTWKNGGTVLLWLRGTYNKAQNFDMAVVGLLQHPSERMGVKKYVEATPANTAHPVVSVPESSDTGWEDSPTLKTQVTVSEPGTYDVWANFWAGLEGDWCIRTGLSEQGMRLFRHMACRQFEKGEHDGIPSPREGDLFLYQVYLGRVRISYADVLEVFVDDEPSRSSSQGAFTGNCTRTWYDGISYASV